MLAIHTYIHHFEIDVDLDAISKDLQQLSDISRHYLSLNKDKCVIVSGSSLNRVRSNCFI